MHGAIIVGLFLGAAAATAQPVRYRDDVFSQVAVTSNIEYGSSVTHAGADQKLLLDLYRPQGDTARSRPLIIFVHGGGFSAGSKTDLDIVFLCQTFARKGYVTASIEYRLQGGLSTQALMGNATYRAVQDGKASVRFLRAHRAEYGIDEARILMGGTSAGGVMSLLVAYLEQDEVSPQVDVASLGSLESSGGNLGVSSAVQGAVNCWGGVGDSTLVQDGKVPALHFHGTADNVVPYDIGHALGNPALTMVGSACVHRNLARAGVKSTLKPFVGMGHGMAGNDARVDTLVAMTRDFAYEVLVTSLPASLRMSPKASPNVLKARQHRADGRRIPPAALSRAIGSAKLSIGSDR